MPDLFVCLAVEEARGDGVVAVRVDVRAHHDLLSRHAFDGEGPVIDLRLNYFYYNTFHKTQLYTKTAGVKRI